jgi:acyl-[acyl-carrier-protein]-phospholipid O-acyltransferase/long-chain-fatty-acid--[acyl-carrier-protein] ligase
MITVLRWLLRLFYRFSAWNEAVLKTPGPVLLLPNHVSWWDWLLIGACLEKDWRFVTSSATADLSFVHKFIMDNSRTFPVDINSPYAIKHMAEYLQKGGRLVLFPEGRISATGSLMKLFDGTGFLIHRTGAKVITAYIRGAHHLPFSGNPFHKRWFPKLSVHFGSVQTPPAVEHVTVSDARHRLTDWLRHRMLEHRFQVEMEFGPATLPAAILSTACELPGKVILEDITRQKITYRRVLLGACLIAQQLRRCLGSEPRVGLLLPNVNAFPVVTLAIWAAGRIPAVLNYTTGSQIMLNCAQLAGLKQVVSSRAFVEKARLDLSGFAGAGIEVIWMEDIRARISTLDKLFGMVRQRLRPDALFKGMQSSENTIDDTAVVLFTSGSEGNPKGVELSHRNLLANIRQMLSVIDLGECDRFFNALPLFHSFGLSVGMFLPLVQGVYTFLYPSPLHYRVVPSAFYNLDCTVFFGTNTFLTGYGRKADPYDFRSLRYLFAGAEKLQEATSNYWMKKFGVRVFEGYGVTECSPVVSVNVPTNPRQGSAGQLLPGIECRIDPVDGVADGGRLFVRGPSIMRGYLNPEANAKFRELKGWYDTGDIASIDEEGFLHIKGRLKRFAKISGEMVSLTAVEEALAGAFPEYGLKCAIAVVSVPDAEKGERLVAVTNEAHLTLDKIRTAIRARGLSNLAVPRDLKYMSEIPRLGTGKINHRELQTLV